MLHKVPESPTFSVQSWPLSDSTRNLLLAAASSAGTGDGGIGGGVGTRELSSTDPTSMTSSSSFSSSAASSDLRVILSTFGPVVSTPSSSLSESVKKGQACYSWVIYRYFG